jgi:DNA-directed RNA polymerase delta subunit
MENNILDKIMESQENQKKAQLNPRELVNFLLNDLNAREKEVIKARYGLDREESETLEGIGKKFNITRERVRQIENNGIKRALATDGAKEKLADLTSLAIKNINKHGYVRMEEKLFDELLENSNAEAIDKNCLRFIFHKFLKDYMEPVDIVHTETAWRVKEKELNYFQKIVEGIKGILEKKQEPMALKEILTELDKEVINQEIKELIKEIEDWEGAVNSYLEVSKHFGKNLFDKWGLSKWRSITPKRMRDKIHLILLKDGEPMHYKRIAERINQEQFDDKTAHPATIHNELILDERFVLIGRGIYALKDWGYKPGVISQVVADILKEAGEPLAKEELIKRVLEKRRVKEGSINLTLSDKTLFTKLNDGRYSLANNS